MPLPRYFHLSRAARDKVDVPHEAFSASGQLVRVDAWAAHALARGTRATPAEVTALALLHEVLHVVVSRHGAALSALVARLEATCPDALREASLAFVAAYPPPSVWRGEQTPEDFLALQGEGATFWAVEEMLLLWVSEQNPAYRVIEELFAPRDLSLPYRRVLSEARALFAGERSGLERGESLLDTLLAPARHAPTSVFEQLAWLNVRWGVFLETEGLRRQVLFGGDLGREEARALTLRHLGGGTGTGAGEREAHVPSFEHAADGAARFTPDRSWMPELVILAKNTLVWLSQLGRRYGRSIQTLDAVPDEELAEIAGRGITALWLIGLWERSEASRAIKVSAGNPGAAASPYSIFDYRIADSLGGQKALEVLREKASRHGLRLAADMVPNHMGVESTWIYEHPERFLQGPRPPYPSYRFEGVDLSRDPRVSLRLEDGYSTRTDAAVVFERRDHRTGEVTYIYHGNDGTGLPWNDTAQLDFARAEVRAAVIECILHVCRMFPVVRFDAAMTLAKRHVQRLWYPRPGEGGDIPSRAAHAMTDEEFHRACPTEFWRDVVDRVTAELPDTLLLAEAFWMMEGYFVRDLGMHRVYDSAFMHMLRSEHNAIFGAMLRDVLAHEPQILGRFVHFLSNPDEEPARAGFGAGDKYFGACAMMCTLPGLPLLAHGQFEGLHEKYGMEFREPMWDESTDREVLLRHEREIVPLLRERTLFASVDAFELFVPEGDDGAPLPDVFAYANASRGRRSLFLFHNAPRQVRVHLRRTEPRPRQGGEDGPRSFAEVLGLGSSKEPLVRAWNPGKAESALFERGSLLDGLTVTLGPYGTLTLIDFQPISGVELAAPLGVTQPPSTVPELLVAVSDLASELSTESALPAESAAEDAAISPAEDAPASLVERATIPPAARAPVSLVEEGEDSESSRAPAEDETLS